MARWCPQCGAEYIEGWGTCTTCEVELVDEPPAPQAEEAVVFPVDEAEEVTGDDPFSPVWEGPTPEATNLMRLLERYSIPVDLGEAALPGRSRLEVPRSYQREAQGIVASADPAEYVPPPDPESDDLDAMREPPASPLGAILFVVIALGLVIALLITQR